MRKKANKKVAVLNFVILFILILVGLFVLSVPQFDLSSLSVASFYLYFPSVALLLVYCILYLSFALTKKEHSALEKILNVYTALMIAAIVIAVCASLIVTFCGKNGKAEKERFLILSVLKPYLDLTVPTPIYPFQAQKGMNITRVILYW